MFDTEPFDVEFEEDNSFDVEFEEDNSFDVEFGEIQSGGSGITKWSQLLEKPFERIGETLAVRDGTLDVNIHEVHNDAGGLTTIIG